MAIDPEVRAGFDWVMREVQMPSDSAREAFFKAYATVHNAGHDKAVAVLRRAWPAGASWPSGEQYLRSMGWLPDDEMPADEEVHDYDGPDLQELLFGRLFHVTHRLGRDAQIREYIDSQVRPWTRKIIINRDYWRGKVLCGVGRNRAVSIEEGLALMRDPAHAHPACACTFDPDR